MSYYSFSESVLFPVATTETHFSGYNSKGYIESTTTSSESMPILGRVFPVVIVSLCLMTVACFWMYFRYKKQRFAAGEFRLNKLVEEHLSKIDERISNLETLVLEREKEREYERL